MGTTYPPYLGVFQIHLIPSLPSPHGWGLVTFYRFGTYFSNMVRARRFWLRLGTRQVGKSLETVSRLLGKIFHWLPRAYLCMRQCETV